MSALDILRRMAGVQRARRRAAAGRQRSPAWARLGARLARACRARACFVVNSWRRGAGSRTCVIGSVLCEAREDEPTAARPALRDPHAAKFARVLRDRDSHARAWHRREHGALLHREWSAAESARLSAARPARRDLRQDSRIRTRLDQLRELSRLATHRANFLFD